MVPMEKLGKPSARPWWAIIKNKEWVKGKVQNHTPVTDQAQKLYLLNSTFRIISSETISSINRQNRYALD